MPNDAVEAKLVNIRLAGFAGADAGFAAARSVRPRSGTGLVDLEEEASEEASEASDSQDTSDTSDCVDAGDAVADR